ncbi:MAG TPA: hypothetical protein VJ844_13640 [Mucilaginibacter sp.]|nr:hypothetical protein [Mucilaginibacter sp.]
MDDQLDNELKKRITEVFENYEDTSADEGWLKLREKFPAEEKRRVAAWYWAGMAAALLLLFLGILWFERSNNDNHQQFANKKTPVKQQAQPASQIAKREDKVHADSLNTITSTREAVARHDTDNAITALKKRNDKTITPVISDNKQQAIAVAKQHSAAGDKVITSKGSQPQKIPAQIIAPSKTGVIAKTPPKSNVPAKVSPNNAPSDPGIIANVQPKNNASAQPDLRNPKIDSAIQDQSKTIAANPNGVDMRKETNAKAQVNKSIDEMFKQDKKGSKEKKESKEGKAINVGVYAATYFNYAKGSNNQFNLGAGVSSDIRITRNLKVSTGVSVGQNSLTYAGQPPQQSNLSYNSITAATTSNFSPAKMLYTTSSAPAFKDYSANLVGLDIPLNLKFVFDPQKSGTYLLAGVSSGTFINETYTYSYSNPSLYTANVSQVQNQSTKESFNGFYFAKTLNLAFGTGYTLGRSQLIVEPFVKYPLDGLGSQQLKFGAGGVNLKFNFQVKKQ